MGFDRIHIPHVPRWTRGHTLVPWQDVEMQVKHLLPARRLVELLQGDAVGIERGHRRVRHLVHRVHASRQLRRAGVQHVAAGCLGNHQTVAVGTRHDVHEAQGFVILVNRHIRNLAAQDLGKDVLIVVAHAFTSTTTRPLT